MSERLLYGKFKNKIKEADPKCFVYKIPDTGYLGGKKPWDLLLLTCGIPYAVEFKSKGKKATKYQDFMLEEFKNAGGIGCIFTEGQDMDKFIKTIISIRDLMNKRRQG